LSVVSNFFLILTKFFGDRCRLVDTVVGIILSFMSLKS